MDSKKPLSEPTELYSRERYEKRQGEIRLHMSHFFLGYLRDIYQAFDGDLSMAIILGEISHHNTCHFFSPERETNDLLRELQAESAQWKEMEGCNPYSISCATGIPRETVRRKTVAMIQRGWLEEIPKQGLRITPACADHFGADFSFRFLNGLLGASRKIEALLAEDPEGSHEAKPESPQGKGPLTQEMPTQPIKPPTQKKKP